MGQLVDGKWVDDVTVSSLKNDGKWERTASVVRHQITTDGDFPAEAGRYHLYAAWNCPWAHRVLIVRHLLGLQSAIPVSYVSPKRSDQGWVFDPENGYADELFGRDSLYEIYTEGEPEYTGRVTVPLLFDTYTNRLVSTESADLVRMIPREFASFASTPLDLYPEEKRQEIDAWNERIYPNLNNGVYRAGFARTQSAYDDAVENVFDALDDIESQLSKTRYLTGDDLTEADVRLFPTLARFDTAYFVAFKCCKKRLVDYPHLWKYARAFFAEVAETVRFEVYRTGYFSKSENRNPLGIVPIAAEIDWSP